MIHDTEHMNRSIGSDCTLARIIHSLKVLAAFLHTMTSTDPILIPVCSFKKKKILIPDNMKATLAHAATDAYIYMASCFYVPAATPRTK